MTRQPSRSCPMFRVTEFVKDPALLQPWIDHFARVGVKAEIRDSGKKTGRYSVWREGKEIKCERTEYQRTYWHKRKAPNTPPDAPDVSAIERKGIKP